MPAKKKPAAKKAVKKAATQKTPAEKPAVKKAAAKSPAKKAAAKATKKAASKTAKKGTPKAPKKEAPAKANGADKPKASDILKRTKHHTPAIFKVGTRKAVPVVFTLEDVRDILKKRAREEAKAPRAKREPAPVKVAPRKAEPIPEIPQTTSKHAAASLADILGFGGGTLGGGPAQRTVPRKWKKYHTLLTELRDHVKQSLGMHAEDTLKRSQKEDTGDLSTSADAGTDTFDRDFALSVVSSEQEALKEIEAAIERIYSGRYGTCEITGEPISDERLEAVPFTRFSLEGQRQHEMTARRRVSRGGTFLSEGAEGVSFGDDDGDN